MRRRALAIASILVAAPIAASATIVPATAATVETVVLGDYGTWTVPNGVTSVTLALAGGDGGTTTNSGPGTAAIGAGGRGGTLTATLGVQPGDELFVRVGTAGNGTDMSDITDPLDGTGYNNGGGGWSTGGGSTGLTVNGVLVAGAPGGGAGAGALTLTPAIEVFSSAGGDGGFDAADAMDGATVLLEGGKAGGNTVLNTLEGQAANLVLTPGQFVLVSGAGGAGWPGGSAVSNGFGGGTPTEAFVAGGGGGLPFVGSDLIDPVTGVKDGTAGRDGSATITFVAPAELAATGGNDVIALVVTAAILLLAGALVMAVTRRRASA